VFLGVGRFEGVASTAWAVSAGVTFESEKQGLFLEREGKRRESTEGSKGRREEEFLKREHSKQGKRNGKKVNRLQGLKRENKLDLRGLIYSVFVVKCSVRPL
jgi:hypothetical protein